MVLLEFLCLIGVTGLIGLLFLNSAQSQRQQHDLENAFYKLLENQGSCVSLIQLAGAARVDAQLAKQYLEQQAQFFAAELQTDADGDSFYRFPKLQRGQ